MHRRNKQRTRSLELRQSHRLARGALGLCLFAFASSTSVAMAAGTSPLLAVDGARAFASAEGVVTLDASGRFSFDDLMQFSFPAGLVVARGSAWVRYGLDGTISSGTDPALADGITAEEVTALLTAGTTAAPPAAVTRIAPQRIAVVLPEGFPSGTATVLIYAVLDEDETFISNAVPAVIP